MIATNYRVSIVTVCYNSAATIEDTIQSVLKQNRKDVQHIIIDGGSTDNTLEIVNKYREAYGERLSIVSESDKGIYDAMNKGVRLAEGDMIGILNSDDYYATDKVLDHVVLMLNSNPQLIYGNLRIIDDQNGRILRTWNPGYGNYMRGWIPPHPTLFISKKLYHQVGEYDLSYKISADYDMMIRCLAKVAKTEIIYVDDDFVHMRIGGASNSGVKSIIEGIVQINSILKKNKVPFRVVVNGLRLIKKLNQYKG